MGTKATRKTTGVANWETLLGAGPVAQVAHPTSLLWTPNVAVNTLLAAAAELPPSVQAIVTGGGYISLDYPDVDAGDEEIRQAQFLTRLHSWTLSELSGVISSIGTPDRDLVIGVDVLVNGEGSGQFALWVGQGEAVLVPKRFPVGKDEARSLAGVDAGPPSPYTRVVSSRLGHALILICHDAQAFNRRNRGNVARARRMTARAQAIRELDEARATQGLTWALNVVHWIDRKLDTRTFHISYDQIRTDFSGEVSVAGGFGYTDNVRREDVPALLDRLVAPRDMVLTKIVIYR